MSKAIIVSHIADLDGVASAVLLWHYLKAKNGEEPQVFFTDYVDAGEMIKRVSLDCEELHISDLSQRDVTLVPTIPGTPKLFFYDHHPDSKLAFELWADKATIWFDDTASRCATDLVWDAYASILEALDPALVDLKAAAHSIDLWIKDRIEGDELSSVVAVKGAQVLFNILSAEPCRAQKENYSNEIKQCIYISAEQLRVSEALAKNTACKFVVKDDAVVICAYSWGRTSDVGHSLLIENPYAWIILMDLKRMTLSMRSNAETVAKYNVSVQDIAGSLGGGGHPVAAGAPLTHACVVQGTEKFAGLMGALVQEIMDSRALTHAQSWSEKQTVD